MIVENYTLFFYYDSDGNPTSFTHNGTMYYYIKNLQGDIVKIVGANGKTVANYEYNVWGELLSVKNGNGENFANTNTLAFLNPLRYRGYVYDDETGFYYLQSRYYDPITYRFINADVYFDTQSGTPLSTNMFAYCENNPIYRVDYEGTWYEDENDFQQYLDSLSKRIAQQTKNAKSRADWTTIGNLQKTYNANAKKLKNCKLHYRINSNLFKLYRAAYGQNNWIYNQRLGIFKSFLIGGYNVYGNGCGAIALYNVMRMVAGRANLAQVILELELNYASLRLNGAFGVSTWGIENYLKAHNIIYDTYSSLASYKLYAGNYSISILYIRNEGSITEHYYCIIKVLGKYYSLNRFNNQNEPKLIQLNSIKGIKKVYSIRRYN